MLDEWPDYGIVVEHMSLDCPQKRRENQEGVSALVADRLRLGQRNTLHQTQNLPEVRIANLALRNSVCEFRHVSKIRKLGRHLSIFWKFTELVQLLFFLTHSNMAIVIIM